MLLFFVLISAFIMVNKDIKMPDEKKIDFGPLKNLIGTWEGDKGLDISPEPEGTEERKYYETIKFEAVGDVKNAESQTLIIIRYLQIVKRKSNDETFHDETGYWIWNPEDNSIMLSFSIPRGVSVLSGGSFEQLKNDELKFNVSAKLNAPDWNILQSPFMKKNAKTIEFNREFIFSAKKLTYYQETVLEIYGKTFKHTDKNELIKVE